MMAPKSMSRREFLLTLAGMVGSLSPQSQIGVKDLIDGNQRFLNGKAARPHQDAARRTELVAGQKPFAAVVTCSDSRVPPELVFDLGLGDIFVVRTAGNVVDEMALASLEYAVEILGVPLIVVMGHQKCGAVSAAVQGGEAAGHIKNVVDEIMPAVQKAKTGKNSDLTAATVDIHLANMVDRIKTSEPILIEALKAGKIIVVGSRYDLDTGKVTLL
jgi:carbonic anhydrase